MYRSLNEKGKMAVVLDTGAVSRGSGSSGKNRERDIRKIFVEQNLVEAVILLPENLFYNTTAPGIILVVNKQPRHQGIMLINGSKLFKKGNQPTTSNNRCRYLFLSISASFCILFNLSFSLSVRYDG
jgi:type I restriction enzyme M protein